MQIPGANPTVLDAWGTSSVDSFVADATVWVRQGQGVSALTSQLQMGRLRSQQLTRELYFTPNPIFQAAVNLVAAFLVGDTLSWGEISDRNLKMAVEEFWQVNSFGDYITQRFVIEFLLNGEAAAVWPDNNNQPSRVASRVGALDPLNNLTIIGDTSRGLVAADMVQRITQFKGAPNERSWNEGEFVWLPYMALHNEMRGWPPAGAAAVASMAYIGMVNSRLRSAELLSRLLAVYKAFLDPSAADGGKADWIRKAAAFRDVPDDGTVVPLVVKPGHSVTETDALTGKVKTTHFDGVSESLEFPNPAPGALDAAADMRMLMRLVGVTLGLPEHYLGEGGNATRTTADAMTVPSVKIAQRLQAYIRSFMDRVIRVELVRRYGPDQLYTVYQMVPDPEDSTGLQQIRKRKRVPAALVEIPWVLPAMSEHSLTELIALAEAAEQYGWASSQTLSAGFGFDTAAEAERMAAVGRQFGVGRSVAATPATTSISPTGGNPNATQDPTTTTDEQDSTATT